jgi:hypothetical protein
MPTDPNMVKDVFFIGIGNAFFGVANLLINRGKRLRAILKQKKLNSQQRHCISESTESFHLLRRIRFVQLLRPRKFGCRNGTEM